jgi:hypothetical protein
LIFLPKENEIRTQGRKFPGTSPSRGNKLAEVIMKYSPPEFHIADVV